MSADDGHRDAGVVVVVTVSYHVNCMQMCTCNSRGSGIKGFGLLIGFHFSHLVQSVFFCINHSYLLFLANKSVQPVNESEVQLIFFITRSILEPVYGAVVNASCKPRLNLDLQSKR